jgi:prephenate dehydratase
VDYLLERLDPPTIAFAASDSPTNRAAAIAFARAQGIAETDIERCIFEHSSISSVCEAVITDRINFGVVMIEDSDIGLSRDTQILLINSDILVHREVYIPVGNNRTQRFFLLSKHIGAPCGRDRSVLVFGLQHEPGSLSRVLSMFTDHEINMSTLESIPSKRGAYRYDFYVELEGHSKEPRLVRALEQLSSWTTWFRVVGSFEVNDELSSVAV